MKFLRHKEILEKIIRDHAKKTARENETEEERLDSYNKRDRELRLRDN